MNLFNLPQTTIMKGEQKIGSCGVSPINHASENRRFYLNSGSSEQMFNSNSNMDFNSLSKQPDTSDELVFKYVP